ncbi:MAG: NMD3-related protein [Thermoplasmata archaeon]
MTTKCIVCGKDVDRSTIICEDCRKKTTTDGFVKSIKIKKCPNCGSIFFGNWNDKSVSEEEIITSILKNVFNLKDTTFNASGDEYNRKITFSGISTQNGEPKDGQFFLQTSLSTCPVCTKKLGNYYEAIIQLRGEKGERLDSILEYLVRLVEEAPSRDVFLTKMDRIKEGYDLYLSDKQYSRAIARKVIDRFGGTFKETSHLVGMKKGTELYRITVSIRIPDFQKSDILGIDDNLFLVKSIKGDIVTLLKFNGKSMQKTKFQDLEDYKVFRDESDVREADVLYRQGDTAYILDPFDFTERAVVYSGKSDKVRVVRIGEEVLAVPTK